MARPHRERFVFILLMVLAVAVLALAIAQSAHLQPMVPALLTALAVAFLLQQDAAISRLPAAAAASPRLSCVAITPHFPMPPPATHSA
jgi:hypothetical protein